MPNRLTLYDVRKSRLPDTLGLCIEDVGAIAYYVNAAQQRLIYAPEAGDEGWWGTWAEIAFELSRTQPYITLPRDVARITSAVVCNEPIAVRNQWYEYVEFGNGRLPEFFKYKYRCYSPLECYTRNNTPTFKDITNPPKLLRIYPTSDNDVDLTVFISGYDQYGVPVRSVFNGIEINALAIQLEQPFSAVEIPLNVITGIQKEKTSGQVHIHQVDPNTGEEERIHTLEPSETSSWYRRYYFNNLPYNCCSIDLPATVQVRAIAKLDLIPVEVDTDYLLIQNLEAIIEECMSIRLGQTDSQAAQALAAAAHSRAIHLLKGELTHYLGKNKPAVSFAPFGTARLENARIGILI